MSQPASEANLQFRVLIVDDDHTILNLLKEIVSMVPGCHVETASKPDDAMRIIAGGDVDIVFTDIHMPGATGIEMLQDIIRLEKTPEVIVMTAHPSSDVAQQVMELGASSLLAKPFEDISLVELELDKAIKSLIRQRASEAEVREKKEALKGRPQEEDNDPMMKISLDDPAPAPESTRSIYDEKFIRSLVEVEGPRCDRYNRQFALAFVDIPPSPELQSRDQIERYQQEQRDRLLSCIRSSDVLAESAEEDRLLVMGFECNKTGANVMEYKFKTVGFDRVGIAVYPGDGSTFEELRKVAESQLNERLKHKIFLLEEDEFFGRIVQNMLSDPKYQIDWAKQLDEADQLLEEEGERVSLMICSLSKNAKQWEFFARLKKEKRVQWPILLFTDVALNDALKKQLHSLGVKAIVKKGASQEELLYIVQSFVMQASASVARKNPRALVTVPVVFEYEGNKVSSNTFTLSRDGVFIREMNPAPTGARISMELILPNRKGPLKVDGEVLYAVPYFVGVNRIHVSGMAVRFKNLEDSDRDDLDKFISESLTGYLIG